MSGVSGTGRVTARQKDLWRIQRALQAAREVLQAFRPGTVRAEWKEGNHLVTAADRAVDEKLRELLPESGEGWLSEETADDLSRLTKRRVWIVDPLDGTNEFVAGIPEWAISVGLVEEGLAVAGGICNPVTGELFLGSLETGVIVNGLPAPVRSCHRLGEMQVLASRSEVSRGEWDCFHKSPFRVQPVGSVAYKLARVAAGLADATWTFTPKHEWDVAAGVALLKASGGVVKTLDGPEPMFNRREPLLNGLMAFTAASAEALIAYLKNTAVSKEGFTIG